MMLVEMTNLFGVRNAQATVLASHGRTIGLLNADCDTTGIEPDFALVKFKKLAGGGYFKIGNQSVTLALQGLGSTNLTEVDAIVKYAGGNKYLVLWSLPTLTAKL